jgi:site-specific DNA-methyltransferase (adenine-specific)/adenine-specific DNA-methyltransferase
VSFIARPDRSQLPLTEAEVKAIEKRLRDGHFLDEQYRSRLFRPTKEYELSYAGKASEGTVLAETMAVPLQTLKQYGQAEEGWLNKLILGDNLQILKTLLQMKEAGELKNADGTSGVRLCYIDPPFATESEFRGAKGQRAYSDKVAGAEFVELLRRRLIFIHELLSDDGSLYVHLDWRKTHYIKAVLDEIFGEENFRSQIVWQRTNARSTKDQWPRIHDVILFYTKSNDWIYHPTEVAANKKKMPHTLITWKDGLKYQTYELTGQGETKKGESGRPWKGVKLPPGRHWGNSHATLDEWDEAGLIHWPQNKGFPRKRAEEPFDEDARTVVVGDIWTDIDRINQAAKERASYPTQKPEALIDRIIAASSKEGDLVMDCFLGSGTTAVVADGLDRRWIGIDCGKYAVYTAQTRLLKKDVAGLPLQPFELATAGLYDNTLIEEFSFDQFQDFALQLFGCVKQPFQLAQVEMSGTRKGAPVYVFPFDDVDAVMGVPFIDSLHERIGELVSGSVCVIAPVFACDPTLFQDTIDRPKRDGSIVSYLIFRVPYSVIEALQERGFNYLEQPKSIKEVGGAAFDSYGFDFMEPPEVEAAHAYDGDSLTVEIKSFQRGGLDPDEFPDLPDAGRGDLAMVMVDTDEDDGIFNISDCFFADALEKAEWKFTLDTSKCGEHLLLIYLDTHGNERREVIPKNAKPPVRKRKRAKAAA